MIITRSPLRISLGGGGSDIPSFYEKYSGFCLSAAINKYIYVGINRPYTEEIFIKYSKQERCKTVEEIQHPIIRTALTLLNLKTPQIEITTLADIPAETGLGSSGAFTVGLLKALYIHYRKTLTQNELAELACDIEIKHLKRHTGKQDQYISTFGGITSFYFNGDTTGVSPLPIDMETIYELEDNLLLFFTGYTRNASDILKEQDEKTIANSEDMIENLCQIKQIGFDSELALLEGDTKKFGRLMHEHWEIKKQRSSNMSNGEIDELYSSALSCGAAIGGKIVGAGNGGFLMFMAEDRNKLRRMMYEKGYEELRFKFDFEGAKTLLT